MKTTEYLYGDYVILSKTRIVKDGNDEKMAVTCKVGNRYQEIELFREIGTDEWYDEHGNYAKIVTKKRKPLKNNSQYD
jgi:hypothetical protein